MLPHTARILCVEDNEEICSFLSELLRLAGYEAIFAHNFADGLRLAQDEQFDLVLLDNMLADGTGIELCRRIRSLDAETPIIFYSAVSDEAIRQEALSAGAQGYITKIEAFEVLEQTITKLLESKAAGLASAGGRRSSEAEGEKGIAHVPIEQREFNCFVEKYNADYRYLLMRASTGQYSCLLTSFLVLNDLYTVIVKLHDLGNLKFQTIPYPISFRPTELLLSQLGFSQQEVARINGFMEFTKQTQGREFEEIITEGLPIKCEEVPKDRMAPLP